MALDLKKIFESVEGGVLNYDDFSKSLEEAGIKLADLSSGEYVSVGKYNDDLKARDTQIAGLNDTLAQRDKDLKDLNTKLSEAGTDSEKLSKITGEFATLQSKYENDTKELNAKLDAQRYEFAVKDYANSKKFSSNAAKRDFITSMIGEKLKMKDNTILGADDFTKVYSEQNADAFIVENQNPDPNPNSNPDGGQNPNPAPNFSGSVGGNGVNPSGAGEFNFNFAGVREHK